MFSARSFSISFHCIVSHCIANLQSYFKNLKIFLFMPISLLWCESSTSLAFLSFYRSIFHSQQPCVDVKVGHIDKHFHIRKWQDATSNIHKESSSGLKMKDCDSSMWWLNQVKLFSGKDWIRQSDGLSAILYFRKWGTLYIDFVEMYLLTSEWNDHPFDQIR